MLVGKLMKLWRDDAGMTTVEYALLMVLIVTVAILSWQTLGQKVNTAVTNVGQTLP